MPEAPGVGDERCRVLDLFDADAPRGRVVGTPASVRGSRVGTDGQRVFSIDHHALRIAPLIEPGWGRAVLAYGPFERTNGLTLCVFMLNGHNTAQAEHLPERLLQRFDRWARGSGAESRPTRIIQWLKSGRVLRTLRQFRWWMRLRKSAAPLTAVDENLAIGWFDRAVPDSPPTRGNALVMHATGADNGELWATVESQPVPVVKAVGNIPLYYVVALREQGAIYYAASVPGTRSLPSAPMLRPLAIDARATDSRVYAAISQSTIGQIGFRLDSRIYGVCIADVARFHAWCGGAHAADSLTGDGPVQSRPAEAGGSWIVSGDCRRGTHGMYATEPGSLAILVPQAPTGLIHGLIEFSTSGDGLSLIWRWRDASDHWGLLARPGGCTLYAVTAGVRRDIAQSNPMNLPLNAPIGIQMVDDGHRVQVAVGGEVVLSAAAEPQPTDALGVGIHAPDTPRSTSIRQFEAHPLHLNVPPELDLGCPPMRLGLTAGVKERFEGPPATLDGKKVTEGNGVWVRTLGAGVIDIVGDGSARVRASRDRPNPGRTLFTMGWNCPGFVDMEVEMTIPGTARGEREHPRAGFVVWQDHDNYVIWNLWRGDSYDGGSVSTFFRIDGFEDLYDAVWTNIGTRASYGDRVRLRVVLDEDRYLVFLDGEAVLFRRLSDVYPRCRGLTINRIGLAVNWEWGDDTGTILRDFTARLP